MIGLWSSLISFWSLAAIGQMAKNYKHVRKCCPQQYSLNENDSNEMKCLPSKHNWLYANYTFYDGDISLLTFNVAKFNNWAICIDNYNNSIVSAEQIDNSDLSTFQIPLINSLKKCCPHNRRYAINEQTCGSVRVKSRSQNLQEFLNAVLGLSPGIIDIEFGAPICSNDEVLVDYLIMDNDLHIQMDDTIIMQLPTNDTITVNLNEICMDLTERRNVIIIRSCQDSAETCSHQTCIRKCCPFGEIYVQKGMNVDCKESSSFELEGPSKIYELIDDQVLNPVPAYPLSWSVGDPCLFNKFLLNPNNPDDISYLLINGSLLLYEMFDLISSDNLCYEYVTEHLTQPGDNYVYICFPSSDYDTDPKTVKNRELWGKFVVLGIGMTCSCFFLFLTLIVYSMLPSLQNLHGMILVCYIASLFSAYCCLIVIQLFTDIMGLTVCLVLGFSVQFTFLSAFAWLNVICFDIWWTFGSLRSNKMRKKQNWKRFFYYSLYGWGVPCVITGLSMCADLLRLGSHRYRPLIGHNFCFLNPDFYGYFIYFTGPQAIMTVTNIVFFVLTSRYCNKVKNELERVRHSASTEKKFRADRNKFIMTMKLGCVMGVSWIWEVISILIGDPVEMWYLGDAANALQGLLIFCIFVLKRDVLKGVKRRLLEVCSSSTHRRQSTCSTVFTVVGDK